MDLKNTLLSEEARYKRHKFIYMNCPRIAKYTETERSLDVGGLN